MSSRPRFALLSFAALLFSKPGEGRVFGRETLGPAGETLRLPLAASHAEVEVASPADLGAVGGDPPKSIPLPHFPEKNKNPLLQTLFETGAMLIRTFDCGYSADEMADMPQCREAGAGPHPFQILEFSDLDPEGEFEQSVSATVWLRDESFFLYGHDMKEGLGMRNNVPVLPGSR